MIMMVCICDRDCMPHRAVTVIHHDQELVTISDANDIASLLIKKYGPLRHRESR